MGKVAKKPMILFIDSDERSLAFYRALASDEGFDYATADNAESAMEVLKAHRPDSIILDLHLSGINGLEFCLRLKNSQVIKGIPIGIILSRPEDRLQIGSLSSSADELFCKPLSAVEMKLRLKSMLEKETRLPLMGTHPVSP